TTSAEVIRLSSSVSRPSAPGRNTDGSNIEASAEVVVDWSARLCGLYPPPIESTPTAICDCSSAAGFEVTATGELTTGGGGMFVHAVANVATSANTSAQARGPNRPPPIARTPLLPFPRHWSPTARACQTRCVE